MQVGAQVLYRIEDVRGLKSKAIKGMVSPEEALSNLLEGTPLKVRRDGANAVVIFQPLSQSAPPNTAPSLESVTITAQKRPEPAQSVPISVTGFTARALENYRIENLEDLSRLSPGLLVSKFSQSSPTIAIRGANNTFSQIGVNKPVAVVIDDVFVPRNSAASFDLFDLESIAVLKGPQGTLFGRNVTGGAIVIETRKPEFDGRELEAQVTAGNLGARQFNGLASFPLSDNAAFKVSASLQKRQGYGTDRLTGSKQDNIDSQNLRGQLRLAPSQDLDVLFSADFGQDRNNGRTLSSNTLGDDGNRRTSELGVSQGFDRTIWGASAKIDWKLAQGQLTSITAYRHSEATEDYSGVGANFNLLATGTSQTVVRDADKVSTFSQELRYASPKWDSGDFVVGLYYLNEKGSRQLATRGLAARTGVLASSILSDQNVDTSGYAVFADGTLHLPSDFDLSAGIRYTYDRKEASLNRSDLVRPVNNFAVDKTSASWTEVTPRLALSWKPSADFMAYGSITQGFTAGGFNTEAASAAIFRTTFNPETVTNQEVGVKTQWLNKRLRVNASIFNMKYADKQELIFNSTTGILNIVNASSARIKGAEVEISYRPVRWFGASLNYGRLDATYDRFVFGTVNNSGNPLGSSPRNRVSAAADIRYPLETGGFVLGALSYSRTDTYNTGAANDPNLQIPAYSLANASLGYESADGRWRLIAWVKNLADKEYILTRSTQVVRAEYLGTPRTFGLTLGMRF